MNDDDQHEHAGLQEVCSSCSVKVMPASGETVQWWLGMCSVLEYGASRICVCVKREMRYATRDKQGWHKMAKVARASRRMVERSGFSHRVRRSANGAAFNGRTNVIGNF